MEKEIRHRVHKIPLLNHFNLVQISPYFSNIHFNIILLFGPSLCISAVNKF